MRKRSFYNKFKYFNLICYIVLSCILIVEACINGPNSSQQSNQIGNTLADVFNDLSGEQAKKIIPSKIEIKDKIDTAYIGDTFQIKYNIYPEDANHNSLNFYSTDLNVATITNDGLISFISDGKVIISVTSNEDVSISDSMNVIVKEVQAKSISSTINLDNIDANTDAYILETNNNYKIDTEFTPSNTSNKELVYSCDKEDYISITNGMIYAKLHSYNEITTVTVTHKATNKTSSFNVIVKNPGIIDATSIDYENIELVKTQSQTIIPIFTPGNATYKEIELEKAGSEQDCITINNNTITGNSVGSCTLIIKSKYYPNLVKEVQVTINEQKIVKSFDDISINSTIVVGELIKINFINVLPAFADTSKIQLTSSNTNVGIIDEERHFVAKNEGKTTISATLGSISINKTIDVIARDKYNDIKSFSTSLSCSSFEINQSYNFKDICTLFIDDKQTETLENISFSLEDNSLGNINGNWFSPQNVGITNLIITHNLSGKYDTQKIYINPSFKLKDEKGELLSSQINIDYGDDFIFTIDEDNEVVDKYSFEYSDGVYTNEIEDKKYKISFKKAGKFTVNINPIIHQNEHIGKTLNFIVEKGSLTSKGYKLGYACFTKNMVEQSLKDDSMPLMLNSFAYVKPLAIKDNQKNELDTFSDVQLTYELEGDNKIVDIEQENNLFEISPNSLGHTVLTIKDNTESNNSDYDIKIDIYVLNRIVLKDENDPYSLVGKTLNKISSDIYEITNGNSVTLNINLDYELSTYTNVLFSSSNEEVAKIDSNGIITPLKEGTTKIKYICYDGVSNYPYNIGTYKDGKTFRCYTKIENKIELRVQKQKLITDLNSFLLKVRKGIGHFGAFLVLGIFSSFTYMLFFEYKKWKWSIPLNLFQGVSLAIITEIIQLFVPGRSGLLSDVLIDSMGFLISTILITVILLIYKYKKVAQK